MAVNVCWTHREGKETETSKRFLLIHSIALCPVRSEQIGGDVPAQHLKCSGPNDLIAPLRVQRDAPIIEDLWESLG